MLGAILFESGKFERAKQSLDRVRLEGSFSNQALLRAGWAGASAKQYDRALVPWNILADREPTDVAVILRDEDRSVELRRALERVVSEFRSERMELRLRVHGDARLPAASAANLVQVAREADDPGASVVTILSDSGERYLDTYYNPEWVSNNIGDLQPYLAQLADL